MREADNMTGAELQTLREACGLSREELGALAGVAARTVKHWENGRAGVPADVAALVLRMDFAIAGGAWAALIEARRIYAIEGARAGGPLAPWPRPCVLVRARSLEDMHAIDEGGNRSGEHAPGLTWPALGGSVARLAQLIATQRDEHGQPWPAARVVWFAPPAYAAWLQAKGTSHNGDQLQAWALAQIPAQSIPHRADQPPA